MCEFEYILIRDTKSRLRASSPQSDKLFLKSSELELPQPLTRRRVSPPPLVLTDERGGGRVPIPTRGHTQWYSVYVCTLWSSPLIDKTFSHLHLNEKFSYLVPYIFIFWPPFQRGKRFKVNTTLLKKVHKIENYFGSEFEFYTISLLVMLKY